MDRDFWYKAGELGLLGTSVLEEYGGGGGTLALQNTRFELAECATIARIARVFVDDCIERSWPSRPSSRRGHRANVMKELIARSL